MPAGGVTVCVVCREQLRKTRALKYLLPRAILPLYKWLRKRKNQLEQEPGRSRRHCFCSECAVGWDEDGSEGRRIIAFLVQTSCVFFITRVLHGFVFGTNDSSKIILYSTCFITLGSILDQFDGLCYMKWHPLFIASSCCKSNDYYQWLSLHNNLLQQWGSLCL